VGKFRARMKEVSEARRLLLGSLAFHLLLLPRLPLLLNSRGLHRVNIGKLGFNTIFVRVYLKF